VILHNNENRSLNSYANYYAPETDIISLIEKVNPTPDYQAVEFTFSGLGERGYQYFVSSLCF